MAITKAICNKGFSGNSSILPRINFCASGQGRSPPLPQTFLIKFINLFFFLITVKSHQSIYKKLKINLLNISPFLNIKFI